jgi:hypothetical protein
VVVAVIEIGCGGRVIALEILDLWKVYGINKRGPGKRPGNDREEKERGKSKFARHLVPPHHRNRVGIEAMVPAHASRFVGLFWSGSQELHASWALSERVAL